MKPAARISARQGFLSGYGTHWCEITRRHTPSTSSHHIAVRERGSELVNSGSNLFQVFDRGPMRNAIDSRLLKRCPR